MEDEVGGVVAEGENQEGTTEKDVLRNGQDGGGECPATDGEKNTPGDGKDETRETRDKPGSRS